MPDLYAVRVTLEDKRTFLAWRESPLMSACKHSAEMAARDIEHGDLYISNLPHGQAIKSAVPVRVQITEVEG
jgi:hypothetical protein